MIDSTLKEGLEKTDKVVLRNDVGGGVGCLRIEKGNILIVCSGEERIEFTESDDARALDEERTGAGDEGTKRNWDVRVDTRALSWRAIGLRRLLRVEIRRRLKSKKKYYIKIEPCP